MAKAPIEKYYKAEGYEDVEAGIVYWPMSVLRLRSKSCDSLIDLGDKVLKAWRGYTDEAAFVYAETEGEPHNTITPIARKTGICMNWIWCCEITLLQKSSPLGVYHPTSGTAPH